MYSVGATVGGGRGLSFLAPKDLDPREGLIHFAGPALIFIIKLQ